MKLIVLEDAETDLDSLDGTLRKFFIKHIEKILILPPRRHMHFGIPYHVINVTRQARLIYKIEKDEIFIVRCFATHKEYERWYLSFK